MALDDYVLGRKDGAMVALEEAAKIADAWANSMHNNDPSRRSLMKVAAEIREMKGKTA